MWRARSSRCSKARSRRCVATASIVVFEHGTGSAEAFGTLPGDIYQLLREKAGLRIYDLDGSGPYTGTEFERVFYAAERVNFVARV